MNSQQLPEDNGYPKLTLQKIINDPEFKKPKVAFMFGIIFGCYICLFIGFASTKIKEFFREDRKPEFPKPNSKNGHHPTIEEFSDYLSKGGKIYIEPKDQEVIKVLLDTTQSDTTQIRTF